MGNSSIPWSIQEQRQSCPVFNYLKHTLLRCGGSASTAPPFLTLPVYAGEWPASCTHCFPPGNEPPIPNTEDWVGPRASLDAIGKKKKDFTAGFRTPLSRPSPVVICTTFFYIGIVGGGVQFGPLGIAVTNRPIVPAPGFYDDGEIGGIKISRGNRSTRRKPAPLPLCPPQTPHTARTRTRAAAVGSQWLTARATARPNVSKKKYRVYGWEFNLMLWRI
jgi:hypothetical protein